MEQPRNIMSSGNVNAIGSCFVAIPIICAILGIITLIVDRIKKKDETKWVILFPWTN